MIKSDFAIYVFCRDVEISSIGNYKIPKYVTGQNSLETLMKSIKKIDKEQQQIKSQNVICI